MKQIESVVNQVLRRLFLQDLVRRLPWYLLACLGVAAAVIAVPKLVFWAPLSEAAASDLWYPAWGWGAVVLALGLCLLHGWRSKASRLRAAEELDRRCGLKQRVSATLASSPGQADAEFYQALVLDTQQQIERVHVPDEFPIRSRWTLALPLLPILLLLGLAYLPAAPAPVAEASADALTEETRAAVEELLRSAVTKRTTEVSDATTEAEGAEIMKRALEEVEKTLAKPDASKREVLVALNQVKQSIQDQQERLGQTEALKQRLNQLQDPTSGPADKFQRALQAGDSQAAQEQLAQLAEQLAQGEMTPENLERLADQMQQLRDQLQDIERGLEKQKQELQQQLDQALAKGDLERAAEIEKQQAALKQQQQAAQPLQQLGQQAQQLAEQLRGLKGGQPLGPEQKRQLQEALQQMQQPLENMQMDAQQMQQLQQMMDQLEELKQDMNCENGECEGQGQGQGQKQGQGQGQAQGQGQGQGQQPGADGMGQGAMPGEGEPLGEGGQAPAPNGQPGSGIGAGHQPGGGPGADGDTKFYDTRTRPDVKPGQVTKIGSVGGPNRPGISRMEIQNALQQAAESPELTPSDLQDIPAKQREHVRQYFQQLRDK